MQVSPKVRDISSKLVRAISAKVSAVKAERLRKRHEAISGRLDLLKIGRWHLNSEALSIIDDFARTNIENIKALERYFLGEKFARLLKFVDQNQAIIKQDRASANANHRFSAYSGDLLEGFDQDQLSKILKNIARGYKVSHSSNTGLTTALVTNRAYGSAAYSAIQGAQNSYRAGAHNAGVEQAFLHAIKYISFSQCASDISDEQVRYTRIARRFCNFDLMKPSLSKRLYFSLVFNGGECHVDADAVDVEFRDAALGEFFENFQKLIMSPREAAIDIDKLIRNEPLLRTVAECSDVGAIIKDRYDLKAFLP